MTEIDAPIRAALERSGVAYEVLDCDPDLADTAVFCAHYGYAHEESANTILVKSKTGAEQFVVCVLLATTRLDVNKAVRKRMGVRKASFAAADDTKRITGMEIGGVTPIALPEDLKIWVDQRVVEAPRVILGAGIRAAKIIVPPAYFRSLANCEIIADLALPLPAAPAVTDQS